MEIYTTSLAILPNQHPSTHPAHSQTHYYHPSQYLSTRYPTPTPTHCIFELAVPKITSNGTETTKSDPLYRLINTQAPTPAHSQTGYYHPSQ
jgi:hypothetical protein